MLRPPLTFFRGAAFTLPELMLGMAITAMTLGALSALALAVGQNWEEGQNRAWRDPKAAGTRAASYQSTLRVQEMARHAKYITWAGTKSDNSGSGVFMWACDDVSPDSMQLCEVALLEFDSSAGTLTLYQVPSDASNAALPVVFEDINGEGDIAMYKLLANVVSSSRVMLREVVRFVPVAHNPADAGTRPSLEYVLEIRRGSKNRCEYQSVALRAASMQPP